MWCSAKIHDPFPGKKAWKDNCPPLRCLTAFSPCLPARPNLYLLHYPDPAYNKTLTALTDPLTIPVSSFVLTTLQADIHNMMWHCGCMWDFCCLGALHWRKDKIYTDIAWVKRQIPHVFFIRCSIFFLKIANTENKMPVNSSFSQNTVFSNFFFNSCPKNC